MSDGLRLSRSAMAKIVVPPKISLNQPLPCAMERAKFCCSWHDPHDALVGLPRSPVSPCFHRDRPYAEPGACRTFRNPFADLTQRVSYPYVASRAAWRPAAGSKHPQNGRCSRPLARTVAGYRAVAPNLICSSGDVELSIERVEQRSLLSAKCFHIRSSKTETIRSTIETGADTGSWRDKSTHDSQ